MKNRINFFIYLSIFFAQPCLAQTGNSSTVNLNAADPVGNKNDFQNIVEEKGIEFFIIGMKGEKDLRTIENLLNNQKGIDRSRIGGNAYFCTVITLKGSDINESFIRTLLETKGFGIKNYSERWINKPSKQKGERCFIEKTN